MSEIFKFKEHYFTSSKYKGGFFTLDHAYDLSQEEINELEKKGIYNPPLKFSNSPTDLEIDRIFPVNISFFRLQSSGRYVYLHSKYLGRIHHGKNRFGNFFSHSIVLADGEPSYPAKALFDNKNIFKTSFSLDEDINYYPKINEDVHILIDTSIDNLEKIFLYFIAFLTADIGRINIISKVFDLISDGKISKFGYNITICNRKELLTDLVLAINFFLPRNLANKISFATYVSNPESKNYAFNITGVIPECGIQRLPDNHFILIDESLMNEYCSVSSYSQLLVKIINSSDYSKWNDFLSEMEAFGVSELNNQMNHPASYILFCENIKHKNNIDEVKELFSNIPISKIYELRNRLKNSNHELFILYLYDEIQIIIKDSFRVVEKKCKLFVNLYNEFHNTSSFYESETMACIIKYFMDSFGESDKKVVSLSLLSDINFLNIEADIFSNILEIADSYFEDETIPVIKKIYEVKKISHLIEVHRDSYRISNIVRYNKFNNLLFYSKSSSLCSVWEICKNDICILSLNSKTQLFKVWFNGVLLKDQYENMIQDMLNIIDDAFYDKENDFWLRFFEENESYNTNNSFDYPSLSYVKKYFVANIYIKNIKRVDLVKSFKLDQQSIIWIQEQIYEHTKDLCVIEKFKNDYPEFLNPGTLWDYNIFTKNNK